jgi:hypothetical protein
MIVCTLTWQEPEEGSHTILFPDEDWDDLQKVSSFCEEAFGDEVGGTSRRRRRRGRRRRGLSHIRPSDTA